MMQSDTKYKTKGAPNFIREEAVRVGITVTASFFVATRHGMLFHSPPAIITIVIKL